MTRSLSLLLLILATLWGSSLKGSAYQLKSVSIEGLERTDKRWILRYLDLECPCSLTDLEIQTLEEKILTTQVFLKAKVFPHVNEDKDLTLKIVVEEKWTTIPVVRESDSI